MWGAHEQVLVERFERGRVDHSVTRAVVGGDRAPRVESDRRAPDLPRGMSGRPVLADRLARSNALRRTQQVVPRRRPPQSGIEHS